MATGAGTPVENASLMPWLTGTAFLHSLMIQEKRGMLKVWNVSLVLATGTLAIMGTFLVRSGVLNSIHAFGGATLGVPFVCLIAVLIAGSIYLVVTARDMLRTEHRLDSLLSRESIFLANNLVLVALCFVIFWGTYFPLISEALTGQEASVGPPWFDRYTVPLALVLVLLSGIGPVIAWRRATLANARRNFLVPGRRRARDARGAGLWRRRRASRWRSPCSAARRSCSAASGRSSSAARARGGRWRARRCRVRCSRSCAATAAATAATSSTSGSRCCSSAWPPRRPSSTPPSSVSRLASRPASGAYTVRYVRPTATITPKYDGPTRARRSASVRCST